MVLDDISINLLFLLPLFLSSKRKPVIRIDMTAFFKMHGLGNDFIVLDARVSAKGIPDVISKTAATALSDRHFGIGCDQILVIRPSQNADIFLQILNSDGTAAMACGNGTRCVADHIMREFDQDLLAIETDAGILQSWRVSENPSRIADMGSVYLDWETVPLASRVIHYRRSWATSASASDLSFGGKPACSDIC